MSIMVLIYYDNFQRGLSLDNQRGGQSSAYFRGTHQVAHEIIPFEDDTFDAMYVPVTYLDQALPSPWGMSAYEGFDQSKPANFFFNWNDAETMSTPNFSASGWKAILIKWLKLANILVVFKKSFPACASGNVDEEGVDPFERCPAENVRQKLEVEKDVSPAKLCDGVPKMAPRLLLWDGC